MVHPVVLSFILSALSLQICQCTINKDLGNSCLQTKGCLYKPNDCVPFFNCTYFMSYAVSDSNDSVIIELLSQVENAGQQEYVAIGLSSDQSMGQDAVTFCVYPTSSPDSVVRLGYNPSYNNILLDSNPTTMVTDVESTLIESTFACRFSQKITPPSSANQDQVRPLDHAYYIFLVGGRMNGNNLIKHTTDKSNSKYPYISAIQVTMTNKGDYSKNVDGDISQCVSAQNQGNLVKAHGILMMFGWWVFVAMAILFARHFKTHWATRKLLGKDVWFNFHRMFNGIGILMIAAGFICIFISTCGDWVGSEIPKHAITGMTAVVCAFLQPIIAAMRCHPGTAKRPIFNWIHRTVGLGGFCCACATIWFASYFDDVGLHTEHPRAIMILYWVVLFVVVVTFELLTTMSARIRHPKVTDEMHMDNHNDLHPIADPGVMKTHLYADLKTILLGIFFGLALAIVIVLSCFVGLY